MMTGGNIADTAIQQLVDRTILDMDATGTGKISFEDFYVCLKGRKVLFDSLVKKLNVDEDF
jgi:hypothetical protein